MDADRRPAPCATLTLLTPQCVTLTIWKIDSQKLTRRATDDRGAPRFICYAHAPKRGELTGPAPGIPICLTLRTRPTTPDHSATVVRAFTKRGIRAMPARRHALMTVIEFDRRAQLQRGKGERLQAPRKGRK